MQELPSVSLGCSLTNAVNQAWSGPFNASQGTRRPSLHRFCKSPPSRCKVMPRQCLPAYANRSSMAVSFSAVNKVCGPHLGAPATLPATLFVSEVGLLPNVAAALLMAFSLFLATLTTSCSPIPQAGATWVKRGLPSALHALEMPNVDQIVVSRAFKRPNDPQRSLEYTIVSGVSKYQIVVNLWAFDALRT